MLIDRFGSSAHPLWIAIRRMPRHIGFVVLALHERAAKEVFP